MFYSKELLGKKSPLSEIWCVPAGCDPPRSPCLMHGMHADARQLKHLSLHLHGNVEVRFRAHLSLPEVHGLFVHRLAAHGKKLVRRAVLKVNVAQTWCAKETVWCWEARRGCA